MNKLKTKNKKYKKLYRKIIEKLKKNKISYKNIHCFKEKYC
jgi:hypothetical protein